jgi:xanthine dehydrogenase accessory factor
MEEVFTALADLHQTGAAGALCTIIKTKGSTPRKEGSKMLVFADGSIVGSVGGGEVEARVIKKALKAIGSGHKSIQSYDLVDPEQGDPGICGGSLEIFIDPIPSPDEIIVIGGGHVGKAVVFLAKWLGYKVVLNDDRKEFCTPQTVPGADVYIQCELSDLPEKYQIPEEAVVVLATRNQKIDITGLPKLLVKPTAYLGVISSKRRWRNTREQLFKAGVVEAKLDKIHAPIGLDIGAETPEEIALSILAEIKLIKSGEATPIASLKERRTE